MNDSKRPANCNTNGPCAWCTIEFIALHVCILGICGVLIGALWVQFFEREFPCPLCLLQRMGMMLATLGPVFILAHGHRTRVQGFSVMGAGFGMSIIGAVCGMMMSTRQVLLHIEPGDPGYGTPVMGMHLYTWALVVFIVILLVSGLMLIFGREPVIRPRSPETADAIDADPNYRPPMHWFTKLTFAIFGLIMLVNVVSAFFESGFNLFQDDNPTSYRLLESKPESSE